jgi:hypothetical protein
MERKRKEPEGHPEAEGARNFNGLWIQVILPDEKTEKN